MTRNFKKTYYVQTILKFSLFLSLTFSSLSQAQSSYVSALKGGQESVVLNYTTPSNFLVINQATHHMTVLPIQGDLTVDDFKLTNQDQFILFGHYMGSLDIQGNTVTAATSQSILLCFDASGNLQWYDAFACHFNYGRLNIQDLAIQLTGIGDAHCQSTTTPANPTSFQVGYDLNGTVTYETATGIETEDPHENPDGTGTTGGTAGTGGSGGGSGGNGP